MLGKTARALLANSLAVKTATHSTDEQCFPKKEDTPWAVPA